MTPERWQVVEELLQAALDRPPEERASFLESACAGDAELKGEAAALVQAFIEAGDFIEQPAISRDARVLISEQSSINIGRIIGPYKIVERLGAGGMGEVYLAEDGRLGRLLALKILPVYFITDEQRLRRFQREARAASALNHPNILTIHEVGEAEDVHFIATEFIDGQTLRELIAKQDLSLEEILDITGQVAFALATAHAAGIIHRDIKPENIMRRADRIVKILDFGIAKLIEQPSPELSDESTMIPRAQTDAGIVLGTVGYMSPEQARGLPVDERTDIWSLGVVLYEMIAGRVPFTGATRVDALVSILEREPPPLFQDMRDEYSPLQSLERIVSKALRKEKSERYQTALEMLADLKNLRRELDLGATFKGDISSLPLHALRQTQSHDEKVSARALEPSASAAISSSATFPHSEVAMPGPRHHYLFIIPLAALLAAAVMVGAFIYRRSVAPPQANTTGAREQKEATATTTIPKLYSRMSAAEQLAFISEQEQHISALMGDRPVKLHEEALGAIKTHVDRYVSRTGSGSVEPGPEGLREIYARAVPFVPLIARSFAARKVPVIIGIYLPMIESEYKPCFENRIGAKGLFQFLPQTARQYGVAHEDMCDVEKMTPAAAQYIADRMAELGDDSQSMTLVLLSYNRGPEWVRNTLRQLRNAENYERNFWTLFANRDQLDDVFRNENALYVPSFFAAAIIGENPQAFDLQLPPLSTLNRTSPPVRP